MTAAARALAAPVPVTALAAVTAARVARAAARLAARVATAGRLRPSQGLVRQRMTAVTTTARTTGASVMRYTAGDGRKESDPVDVPCYVLGARLFQQAQPVARG